MKKYEKPNIVIVKFETEDIIATSGLMLPTADVMSNSLTIDYQEQAEWLTLD